MNWFNDEDSWPEELFYFDYNVGWPGINENFAKIADNVGHSNALNKIKRDELFPFE